MAEKQKHDKELQQLMQESSSLQFKLTTLPSGKTLWCDISASKIRPYISEEFRIQMFQQIHDGRFSVVHIDMIGPLPPSEGMEYCLTRIDRYSSWIEVVLLPAIAVEIVGMLFTTTGFVDLESLPKL
ncbi:retrovirus-related Pol polyprotein from transposon opus [Nephila pilipes]|uniref:Retrovirus-related Pol polyprotein from transposon opus n=1 Tax=Nephila pilipes TaxID=299642 RepID=A0A8X6N1R6_NEPPI|nr:retrovirus-related Pol polyprotein from transposon opus [Nephila pilipes]